MQGNARAGMPFSSFVGGWPGQDMQDHFYVGGVPATHAPPFLFSGPFPPRTCLGLVLDFLTFGVVSDFLMTFFGLVVSGVSRIFLSSFVLDFCLGPVAPYILLGTFGLRCSLPEPGLHSMLGEPPGGRGSPEDFAANSKR